MTSLFSARQLDGIVAELKIEEGFRAHCYKCPAGKHTIGFGRNIDEAGGLGITEDEALDLLENDVYRSVAGARRTWHWFDTMNASRQSVLVQLVFQMGLTKVRTFRKMIAALDSDNPDYDLAAAELLDSKFARQVPQRAERLARQLRN